MTPLHFTPAEVDRLRFERFPHPHPLVQRKREALLLQSEGLPQQPIARIVGVCENTLRSYCAPYQSGGVEALEELNCYQPESASEGHRSRLQAHFQDHPPAGVKEAAALIEARTGLRRSLSPVRQFLQCLGLGRRRFHVRGALNATTHEWVRVTNLTHIHAASVCELLEEWARRVRRPIPVVPDKARSQKCQPVRDLAQRLGLELLDLPACSPRLNRMARLWKFVPKKCLYHRYHGDFAAFCQAIQALLRTLGHRHASALHTLLTWRFQTFREQEVRLAA